MNKNDEVPTKKLLTDLKKSEADEKVGRVIRFKNGKEALAYLDTMIARQQGFDEGLKKGYEKAQKDFGRTWPKQGHDVAKYYKDDA